MPKALCPSSRVISVYLLISQGPDLAVEDAQVLPTGVVRNFLFILSRLIEHPARIDVDGNSFDWRRDELYHIFVLINLGG